MLENFLNSYFNDINTRKIFENVMGTIDTKNIQIWLNQCIREHMRSTLENVFFIESSIGVVFGLLLANGQKIVLKVYSEKIPLTYLRKMNELQAIFYEDQFPAPKVLSPIFPFAKSNAGFYGLIEGNKENGHQNEIRFALAKHLAIFSDIVDKYQMQPLENIFQQNSSKRLWPKSHNVLFDFKKTTKGAGWIAKYAKKAKKIVSSIHLEKKLAHTDWGTKNSIFCNNNLVGILDWDSLGAMSEYQMLGKAAAQFTAHWGSPHKITPSPLEGREFVKIYEGFRHKKFTEEEYKIISACSDYLIAILARFEHAGGGADCPYQDLLRECGDKSFLFT